MKKIDPAIDHGFHAVIPRVVRTGYKELVPLQKWLYTCLKDLCGETGTCYRTVQTLAEETGISTGMISESIPVLHAAGLIHGEKKKRSTGGKPVWHITIVDIWLLNGKIHPTKRSHSEQTQDVRGVNVHTVNDKSAERSHSEHKRSPRELERSHSETEEESIKAVSESSIILEAGKEGTDAFAVAQSSPAQIVPDLIDLALKIGHDCSMPHHVINCHDWQLLNHGTCQDYQQSIDAAFDDPDATVGRMPAIKPENVTPVTAISSDSQPAYRQGATNGHPHDIPPQCDSNGTGEHHAVADQNSGDIGLSNASAQGAVNGHLPATAHPDVDSDSPEHCMDSQGASNGQVTSTQQTFTSVSPFTTGATSALGSPSESGSPRGIGGPHSEQASQATSTQKWGVLVPGSDVDKAQRGKRNGKARAEPVLKCDPAEVQRRINERRGYALEEKVAIIRERTAIKTWCGLHTLDEFEVVMTQLQEHDPYWKKPENKYRITGNTLAVETPKVLAKRNGNGQPAPEKDYTGFDVYKGNGPEVRAALLEYHEAHNLDAMFAND